MTTAVIQFLLDYGLFLAKAVTVVAAIAAIVILSVGLSRKESHAGGLKIEKLNDKYRFVPLSIQCVVARVPIKTTEVTDEV